jgi:formylglycine-generating enzyme required for sulfatase activity
MPSFQGNVMCGQEVPVTPNVLAADLDTLDALTPVERVERLAELAKQAMAHQENGLADAPALDRLRAALQGALESGEGSIPDRLTIGGGLAKLGDGRLLLPDSEDYWARIELASGDKILVGRQPVSTGAFQHFVAGGEYDNNAHWPEASLGWKNLGRKTWADLAAVVQASLMGANQPVVGTNWYEASAYAISVGSRLPTVHERLQIVRGAEKRPYPWGDPFGHGNANTEEEAVGQPCAVGLFHSDRTPEGIWDLAGNAAEWLQDVVGEQRLYHPGSWKQPSLASWAKARSMEAPTYRADDLGFRIVRDA